MTLIFSEKKNLLLSVIISFFYSRSSYFADHKLTRCAYTWCNRRKKNKFCVFERWKFHLQISCAYMQSVVRNNSIQKWQRRGMSRMCFEGFVYLFEEGVLLHLREIEIWIYRFFKILKFWSQILLKFNFLINLKNLIIWKN